MTEQFRKKLAAGGKSAGNLSTGARCPVPRPVENSLIETQAKNRKDVNITLAVARRALSVVRKKVAHVANWDEPLDTSMEGVYRVDSAKAIKVHVDALGRATSPGLVARLRVPLNPDLLDA